MPWLRGTISYQAPARARSRSATSGTAWLRVRSGRVSAFAIAAASSSVEQRCRLGVGGECLRAPLDRRLARSRVARHQLAEQLTALARLKRDILAGVVLEQEFLAPCRELVGPGFDGEQVAAGLRRREPAVPAVVAVEPHRLAPPLGRRSAPPQQRGRDDVVAFAKNIGPYFDGFAGDALDRIAAAVDARIDVLDAKARPGRIGRGHVPRLSACVGAHVGGEQALMRTPDAPLRTCSLFDRFGLEAPERNHTYRLEEPRKMAKVPQGYRLLLQSAPQPKRAANE